jgi:hypothetical protein
MEQRDYLGRLVERMRANRFPVDDPLYAPVAKAWEAASNACVAAATCRNKVHRPPGQSVRERPPWGGA